LRLAVPGFANENVGDMAMSSPPSVNVVRLIYLLVCQAAGVTIALSTQGSPFEVPMSTGLLGGLGVAGVFIWVEGLMKGFTLRGFSTATFGLGVGLFCAWLLTRVQLSSLLEIALRGRIDSQAEISDAINALRLAIDVTMYASLGFLGAILSLRGNRDDFAFIIPYVRFRQDASSGRPITLDAETVIDGRVAGILRSGFLSGRIIVPRFVLNQLQSMVDSDAIGDHQRGQRGLDHLETMRKEPGIQLSVHDTPTDLSDLPVNSRLVETCKLLGARLMTMDEGLTKLARLQDLDVLQLQELDAALTPEIAIGQRLRIALVRTGKEDHQAVGYLPDGTMIVVNHAISQLGKTADVMVVSTLQTGAGTLIFAEVCD
jgi:uncharacterized protein YacL